MYAATVSKMESIARRSRLMRSLAGSMLWVFAACLSLNAAAADDDVPQVVIRVESLSPQSETDAKALYERIGAAARQACNAHRGRTLVEHRNYRNCIADAVARTVDEIGSAALTTVHRRATDAGEPVRTAGMRGTG